MASSTEASELQEQLIKYKPDNLATIIGKLAGDKDNLRVEVQRIKFTLRKQKYEINGTVNFNVIYKTPNNHVKSKDG
jgi:hypothetical protein